MTKKQKTLCAVGAIIVLVAFFTALIFVFGGDNDQPKAEQISLNGTWIIAAEYNNDVPVFVNDQYMVFSNDSVSVYKDDTQKPYAVSSYSINAANQIMLPDISREYKVEKKTEYCYRLYESATKYILLIKNGSDDLVETAVDTSALSGKWNVIMKGDQLNNGESLKFSNDTIEYFKTPGETPTVTANYTISNGNMISADTINLELECFLVSENTMLFVENSGIVWELSKAE